MNDSALVQLCLLSPDEAAALALQYALGGRVLFPRVAASLEKRVMAAPLDALLRRPELCHSVDALCALLRGEDQMPDNTPYSPQHHTRILQQGNSSSSSSSRRVSFSDTLADSRQLSPEASSMVRLSSNATLSSTHVPAPKYVSPLSPTRTQGSYSPGKVPTDRLLREGSVRSLGLTSPSPGSPPRARMKRHKSTSLRA